MIMEMRVYRCLPGRLPAVKAVVLFNASEDQTVTLQKVEWTLRGDDDVAAAIRAAIASWDPARSHGDRKK